MRPSLSDGPLESLEDTLTESMLSPELPLGGDLGVSLTGELAALLSAPRNSLRKEVGDKIMTQTVQLWESGSHHLRFEKLLLLKETGVFGEYSQAESLHHALPGLW